jgi:hypothetical protein
MCKHVKSAKGRQREMSEEKLVWNDPSENITIKKIMRGQR